jgi:hypothetical protein
MTNMPERAFNKFPNIVSFRTETIRFHPRLALLSLLFPIHKSSQFLLSLFPLLRFLELKLYTLFFLSREDVYVSFGVDSDGHHMYELVAFNLVNFLPLHFYFQFLESYQNCSPFFPFLSAPHVYRDDVEIVNRSLKIIGDCRIGFSIAILNSLITFLRLYCKF